MNGPWMNQRRLRWGALLVAVGVFAVPALADVRTKLPEPSILYLEFAGTQTCSAVCGTTPFGRLLADPKVRQIKNALLGAAEKWALTEAEKEGSADLVAGVKTLAFTLLHKGFAIDLLGVDFTDAGPSVALVIAADVGDEGPKFLEALDKLLAKAPMPPPQSVVIEGQSFKAIPPPMPMVPPIHYGVVAGVFLVTVGADTPGQVLAAMSGAAPNLTANASLSAGLAKIRRGDAPMSGLLHVDVKTALRQGRKVFGVMTGSEGFPPPIETGLDELGLASLSSMTGGCQVADGGFRTSLFMATDGQRKGLLALANQAPLSDEDLWWIPRDASFATATNFDWGSAYDEMMRVLHALPGAPAGMVGLELADLEERLGLKLREDILATFGDGFVLFNASSTGGLMFTGTTLVAEVTDEQAADKLLRRGLEALLGAFQNDVKAELLTDDTGKYKVHFVQFVGLPVPVAPAWSFHQKHLILGLTPQVVRATMERMLSADPRAASILANPDFVRGRKLLPSSLVSVSYLDTQAGISELYRLVALGAVVGSNYARQYGLAIDAAMIPTYEQVTERLYGDVWGTAVDDDGIYQVRQGPWPLPVPAFKAGGAATFPLAISVLLPSLSRARGMAKRVVSAANLRSIGTSCMIYAFENQEQYPPDLNTLVQRGDIREKQLCAPLAGEGIRSYVYIPGHTSRSKAQWVVAYESWDGQPEEGANVLFADGSVEFIKPLSKVHELVARTKAEMAQAARE